MVAHDNPIANAATANVPYSHSYVFPNVFSMSNHSAIQAYASEEDRHTHAFWHLAWIMWRHTSLSNRVCVSQRMVHIERWAAMRGSQIKARYGALWGTSRVREGTSEKAHSSVESLFRRAGPRLDPHLTLLTHKEKVLFPHLQLLFIFKSSFRGETTVVFRGEAIFRASNSLWLTILLFICLCLYIIWTAENTR